MTYHMVCNYIKTTVPLVEQELLTLPEHLSSTPGFGWVRVPRSLVLCICFVDCCLPLCLFCFGDCVLLRFTDSDYLPLVSCDHCIICPSSVHWFWLLLWYLVTIVLYVLLRFTDSDYSFGIFKLFLSLLLKIKISKQSEKKWYQDVLCEICKEIS